MMTASDGGNDARSGGSGGGGEYCGGFLSRRIDFVLGGLDGVWRKQFGDAIQRVVGRVVGKWRGCTMGKK